MALALASCLCSGCFIFEELDKGQKYMDDHSPVRNEHAKEKRSRRSGEPLQGSADEKNGMLARIQTALRSLPGALSDLKDRFDWGSDDDDRRSSRRPADPRDAMVRCALDGGLLYTHRIGCEGRGGRVLGEAGRPSDSEASDAS
ncbi:MAG: hypothetical protein JSU66_16870 [Deltaproteobacteria bacterium]|nr:MAG: hypothetical protein JSU66_16870 [Deltaproteobacteria bacterium]